MYSLSVFLIMATASFSGGVVRGVSGFGSAIIHSLVWVVCTSAGAEAGPLQLSVVIDCINNVLLALPLLIITDAWNTGDARIYVSVFVMTTAFSPLGAAMLVGLDVHLVELVMACSLVLVIMLRLDVPSKAWALVRGGGGRGGPAQTIGAGLDDQPLSLTIMDSATTAGTTAATLAATTGPRTMPGVPVCITSAYVASQLLPLSASSAKMCDEGVADCHSSQWQQLALIPAGTGMRSSYVAPDGHGAASGGGGGNASVAIIAPHGPACEPADPEEELLPLLSATAERGPSLGSPRSSPLSSPLQRIPLPSAPLDARLSLADVSPDAAEGRLDGTGGQLAKWAAGAASRQPEASGSALEAVMKAEGDEASTRCMQGPPASLGPRLTRPGEAPVPSKSVPTHHLDPDQIQDLELPGSSRSGHSHSKDKGFRTSGGPRSVAERLAALKEESGKKLQDLGRVMQRLRSKGGRRQLLEVPGVKEGLRVVGWGSLAGMVSGVMAGLTGIGGPPLMLLYTYLEVRKDVVRGTNAWINLFQFRIVIYALMGLIRPADWLIFLLSSCGHAVGLLLGSYYNKAVSQVMFGHLLVVLMVLCAVLLFLAAFDVGVSS